MARISDRNDWFEIWCEDKESIIETMVKNMASDLEHGYDYFGKSIREQKEMIECYKSEYDRQLMDFADMDEKKVNRWCFYDLKRRGAIE